MLVSEPPPDPSPTRRVPPVNNKRVLRHLGALSLSSYSLHRLAPATAWALGNDVLVLKLVHPQEMLRTTPYTAPLGVARVLLGGLLVTLTVMLPPRSADKYTAVGSGYCRDASGSAESHEGTCGVSLTQCEESCSSSKECMGYAHTTTDTMDMCSPTKLRCVVYSGFEIATTHVTSKHHNNDYTCYTKA